MPYVPTMADETPRDTLLDRVKEQGEVVRRLKAARADNTKVRRPFARSPTSPAEKDPRPVTDVPPFSAFSEGDPLGSAPLRAQLHPVILSPSLLLPRNRLATSESGSPGSFHFERFTFDGFLPSVLHHAPLAHASISLSRPSTGSWLRLSFSL